MANTARVSIRVRGLKGLERAFRRLPGDVANQVLEGGVKAGSAVVEAEITRRTPVGRTGLLRRRMTNRKLKSSRLTAARKVGPRAPHAHLVEFGHVQVWKHPKTGKKYVKGHVPAHPFVRPGAEAAFRPAVEVIGKTLGTGIERLAAQGAR